MFFFRKRSKRRAHARQHIVILVGGFVQNHLFQVLANLAMEPPAGTDSESVRDEKVKVLKAMKPLDAGSVLRGRRVHVDGLGLKAAGVRSTLPASRPTTTSAPRTPRFTPPETWPSRRSTLTRRLRRLSWRWPTPSEGRPAGVRLGHP